MEGREWLSLGLVSGEQVICCNCNETIKGANDAEHGLVYLLTLPPLIEVAQVVCEACYRKMVKEEEENK